MLGKTVNGYAIVEYLGKGGFGLVFRAEKGGKSYAIKFIRTEFIRSDLEMKRIDREIAALNKVKSEHTVEYYDSGEYTEDFTTYRYIVMEYLEGQTLRERLNSEDKIYDEKEALALVEEILTGISSIHEAGIIHRDVKPENIFLTSNGVKILDYGLSKIIDYSSITQTGSPLGTFFYMSPEQVKGEREITPASDFYSIGVMLYELLTKQILFYPSSDAQIIYKTINEKPPYPSKINAKISNRVEDIVLKLLEKDAFRRYKTVEDIIKAFHEPEIKKGTVSVDKLKFYARIIQTDTEIVKAYIATGEQFDGADFPINLHKGYKNLHKALRDKGASFDFIADPGTSRLTFSSFSKTAGLKALPYAPSGYDVLDSSDFSSVQQIKDYVAEVIDLQVSNGCNMLTAPFFWFDNTKDDWYEVNLKMLRESADYVRTRYSQYKLLATICTQAEILCRKTERETIIEDYGNCNFDYLEMFIDKIYEDTTEIQLYNYIYTGLAIKEFNKSNLIAGRVPAIGLGLLTVGFDAITSGLGVTGCSDTEMSDNFQKPRLHFMHQRAKEIAEMNALEPAERKDYFFAKIDTAYALQVELNKTIKLGSPNYLNTWKEVLAKF
ncbi:MAG: Protein kinase protein [Patescibacteria group bacterium]|nr:Protein kinase protein [Patescibacteria group bacterium]